MGHRMAMFGRTLANPISDWRRLRSDLAQYDVLSCASAVGGMLTVPLYASHICRLEGLAHLIVAYSRGSQPFSRRRARRWLERALARSQFAAMDDSPEDVFVSNVHTPRGNFRLFPGRWESAHAGVQHLFDSLPYVSQSDSWHNVIVAAESLLRLSDAIARRAHLERWTPPVVADSSRPFDGIPDPSTLRCRVFFDNSDLSALGIRLDHLNHFIFPKNRWCSLRNQQIGRDSPLTQRPLIRVRDGIVCVLPTAVSVAVCRYVFSQARRCGYTDETHDRFFARQEEILFENILPRIDTVSHSLVRFNRVAMDEGCASVATMEIDSTSIAIFGLFHDNIGSLLEHGFDSWAEISPELQRAFVARIVELTRNYETVLACFVFGGFCRGTRLVAPDLPDNALVLGCYLADLEVYASLADASLLRIVKLLQHENWMHDQGVSVHNLSGFLNLFAFWKSHDYCLMPYENPTLKQGDLLWIQNDLLRELRICARSCRNHHGIKAPGKDSHFVAVERAVPAPLFPSEATNPVYTVSERMNIGHSAQVIERKDLIVWINTSEFCLPSVLHRYAFGFQNVLVYWLYRAIEHIPATGNESGVVARMSILLENPEEWQRQVIQGDFLVDDKTVVVTSEMNEIFVQIYPSFLGTCLSKSDNGAEYSLFVAAVSVLLTITHDFTTDGAAAEAQRIADEVTQTEHGFRVLHPYRNTVPTDILPIQQGPIPRFVQPEDVSMAKIELSVRDWNLPSQKEVVIEGDDALRILEDSVDELANHIREHLHKLNRLSIIRIALGNLEAIHIDRHGWHLTACSVLAMCHSRDEALRVAASREQERATAALCSRVIIEMAAAESVHENGRDAGWCDFDLMAARVSLLVNFRSQIDAIRAGLADKEVHATRSRGIDFNREHLDSIVLPYARSLRDHIYVRDARNCGSIRNSDRNGGKLHGFSRRFCRAFLHEYGLEIYDLYAIIRAFSDFAVKIHKSVICFPADRVQNAAARETRLSWEKVNNGMAFLTLPYRTQWNKAPVGQEHKDWWTWRTRRRLSVLNCPIVPLGGTSEAVVFGVREMISSVSYRLNGLEKGYFPSEHFVSPTMKSYCGAARKREGNRFMLEVSEVLNGDGWNTRTEVQMASLGASAALGDVDVVAWHSESKRLLIIECKSLIPRNNVYEVSLELKAFRGDVGDLLGKHLARVLWLKENMGAISRLQISDTDRLQLIPMIVTNRKLPASYLDLRAAPEISFLTIDELRGF